MTPTLIEFRATFDALLARAESDFRGGRRNDAASFLQLAAEAASARHAGLFASARCERLLKSLSESSSVSATARVETTTKRHDPAKVLHVLTQAYSIGGHTRLVWRWIGLDRDKQHSIVITQQGSAPLPEGLRTAAEASGGTMSVLDARAGTLMEAAASLRELGKDFDFIVLHIHPFDVTPGVAWAAAPAPAPILFMNHADHIFWIGESISHLTLNLRQSGYDLSVARRGIPPENNAILPVPLAKKPSEPLSKEAARKNLGLALDKKYAVSMATSQKYAPFGDEDFCKTHSKLLDLRPDLEIIVIGPEPSEAYWTEWAEKTQNRIRAIGPQIQTRNYLKSADVYLDSYPLGSLTSLLEAGLDGVPCASWRRFQRRARAGTLTTDDLALDRLVIDDPDEREYLEKVLQLLDDEKLSSSRGADVSAAIEKYHCSDWWITQLSECYEAARRNFQSSRRPDAEVGEGQVEDQDIALSSLQSSFETLPLSQNKLYSARAKLFLYMRHFQLNPMSTIEAFIESNFPTWMVEPLKQLKYTVSGPARKA